MSENVEKQENIEVSEDRKVYELGYHIVPLVAEEHLPAEVAQIKEVIENRGGVFISEEFPRLRPLTYAMVKKIDAKNHSFNTAYFGWIKFEAPAEELPAVKTAIDNNHNVLRYLLIKTVRENTLVSRAPRRVKSDSLKTEEGSPEVGVVSNEEIDKSIEELVIQ